MPFLVRKLAKREQLSQLNIPKSIEDIYADVPTNEFKTKDGTLSTWHIKSLDDIEDAVLAISLTSSKIDKMDFIIISTDILDQNGLKYQYPTFKTRTTIF